MTQIPVAVVGVSALFPGSSDAGGFWRDILRGRDLITDVPPTHWLAGDYFDPDPAAPDKTYCRRGAFLGELPFDPMEFGIPPANLPATATVQLLALIAARDLLDDAGGARLLAAVDRSRVSVILGATSGQELMSSMTSRLQRPIWLKAMRESGLPEDEAQAICDRIAAHYVPWQEATFPGLLGNVVAGRIANRFDLRGTNCVTDAACASSLAAVSMAIGELALGQADLVVAGGADTMNDIFMYMCFSKTPALSPTGDCRPFSEAADGTLLGEGIAMFALKRLADAERDGDAIYAVLRGIGSSSDGRSKSVYAPLPEGQALALRRAYAAAGYGPGTVELVEAHGTGTRAGDAAEIQGLKQTFGGDGQPGRTWCALGSVKSQIGHTKAAAGAAGLFKAVMALHHKVLPPTIKVDRPGAKLGIEGSPFYLNTEARPWIRDGAHPRRASVSAFGFGGSNFHLTLEEYAGAGRRAAPLGAPPTELVMLSASDPGALGQRARAIVESARGADDGLGEVARRSQETFRAADPFRVAVVAADARELHDKLARALPGAGEAGSGAPAAAATERADGSVAFLFPGQGSQYVGMGRDLAMAFDVARAAWDQAAARREGGLGLHELVFPAPAFSDEARAAQAARLTATEWAQPALAVASLASLAVLRAAGVTPALVAGHSFGELTALCAAGVFGAADLVALARRRGELMAAAAASVPGAMTAVARARAEVEAILSARAVAGAPPASGTDVTLANHNHPTQVVLSGAVPAIEAIERDLAARGIAAVRLPVATAFHSPIVAGAAGAFADHLAGVGFASPAIPVYGNADAAPYPADAAGMRAALAAQLARPVRFVEQIEAMWAAGARVFVEVGPGSVLTELAGRILHGRPHLAVALDRKGRHGVTSLQEALGRLAVAGVPIDLAAMVPAHAPARAPRKKPAMTVGITGTSYGKLYPPRGGAAALPPPNPPRAAAPAPVSVLSSSSSPVAAPSPSPDWLEALRESQRQTSDVHAVYLRAMAETHATYLRAMEAAATGQAVAAPAPLDLGPSLSLPERAPSFAPPARAVEAAPTPSSSPSASASASTSPSVVPRADAQPAVASSASGSENLPALVLAVVAEKTGYPVEMLGMHMELEADLGIDSIKRVEILAALRQRASHLPEVRAADVAALRTLGQIVAHLDGAPPASRNGDDAPAATSTPTPTPTPTVHGAVGPPAAIILPRWHVRAEPRDPCGLPMPGLFGAARLVVTDDGGGIAPALADALARRGLRAEVVAEPPADADAVILLDGLRDVATADQADAIPRAAFRALRAIAGAFTARGGALAIVQDTSGDFGLSGRAAVRAWTAGLRALARTAALEWERAVVRAIDLERGGRAPAELGEALALELLGGGAAVEVGLSAGGARIELADHVAAPLGAVSSLPAGPESVVVATGGARGVAAAAMVALARRTRCRIALFGRTPLGDQPAACRDLDEPAAIKRALFEQARAEGRDLSPAQLGVETARLLAAREVAATLRAIASAGGDARYLEVDVRDGGALAQALDGVRAAWGPITGLVHAAGVIDDKLIRDKTPAEMERVYGTKVGGLRALLAATAVDPLRFIVLFSSAAARAGNVGQSDYAAANETLGRVAAAERARRGPAVVVKSIAWGPWDGGMVTPSLKAHFAGRGVPLIPLDDGARLLVDELGSQPDEVEVLVGGPGGAGPAIAGGPAAALAPRPAEVWVSRALQPQLVDHAIAGRPVVPVAMAIDWFLRAARGFGVPAATLRELRVARGIRVARFDRGERFELTGARHGGGVRLELCAADGVLCYSAIAEEDPAPGDGAAGASASPPVVPALLPPWNGAPIYDGRALFHGPSFQAIQSIDGVSADAIAGRVAGARQLGWSGTGWAIDPLAIDGCLQLAVLWAREVMGAATLPMAVALIRTRASGGLLEQPARCLVRSRTVDADRAACDITLVGADGTLVAALDGVELVRRPDVDPRPSRQADVRTADSPEGGVRADADATRVAPA